MSWPGGHSIHVSSVFARKRVEYSLERVHRILLGRRRDFSLRGKLPPPTDPESRRNLDISLKAEYWQRRSWSAKDEEGSDADPRGGPPLPRCCRT